MLYSLVQNELSHNLLLKKIDFPLVTLLMMVPSLSEEKSYIVSNKTWKRYDL